MNHTSIRHAFTSQKAWAFGTLAATTLGMSLQGQVEITPPSAATILIRYDPSIVFLERDLVSSLIRGDRRKVIADVVNQQDTAAKLALHEVIIAHTAQSSKHPAGVFACELKFIPADQDSLASPLDTTTLVEPTLTRLEKALNKRLVDHTRSRLQDERDRVLHELRAREQGMIKTQETLDELPTQTRNESQQETRLEEEAAQISLDLQTEESALEWIQQQLAESSVETKQAEQELAAISAQVADLETQASDLAAQVSEITPTHQSYPQTTTALQRTRSALESSRATLIQLQADFNARNLRAEELAAKLELSAQTLQRFRGRFMAIQESLTQLRMIREGALATREQRATLNGRHEVLYLEAEALRQRVAELTVALSRITTVEIERW